MIMSVPIPFQRLPPPLITNLYASARERSLFLIKEEETVRAGYTSSCCRNARENLSAKISWGRRFVEYFSVRETPRSDACRRCCALIANGVNGTVISDTR